MKRIVIIFALLLPLMAAAQNQRSQARTPVEQMLTGDFDGLYSRGAMPADMRLSYRQLYAFDLERSQRHGAKVKKAELQNVSYQISRMMAGGEIMYGDPITEMIERIADTLLRDYPQLRDSLRFYTVKSSSVNAFSTGQGMIFVNLGMVAQAENEASLAFAIGHEIVHYYCDHTWVELDKNHTLKTDTSRGATHHRFLSYHQRSRSMESEADSLCALLFYGKSRYWKGVTDGVFDMLQYSYLPFDEVPFDTALFDSPHYRLPRSYYLDQVQPITARDDYDDSLSTHPNLLKRRTAVQRMLGSGNEGAKFLVTTPEEFVDLQTLARWECMRQDLIDGSYSRAFYNAWVEYMQCPDAYDWYPKRVMCQSLYAIAKHKLYAESNNALERTDRVEGEEQQIVNLFRKVQADELAMTAVRFLWLYGHDDPRTAPLCDDMLNDLFGKADFKRDYFLASLDTAVTATQLDTTATNSKYDRIRQKRQNVHNEDARRYYFTDLLQSDEKFANWFNNNALPIDEPVAERYGRSVMVIQPTYVVVNGRSHRIKVDESLREEQRLLKQTNALVRQQGGKPVDFSTASLIASGDGDSYNDYVRLCEWVRENSSVDDKVSMLQSVDIQDVTSHYQVDYVTAPLVVNVENLYEFNPVVEVLSLLYCAIFPPLLSQYGQMNQLTLGGSVTKNTNTGESATSAAIYGVDYHGIVNQLTYESISEVMGKKASGFMGHKFTLEGGLTVAPTILGKHIWDFDLPAVTVRPTLGINYLLPRHGSLHLQADYNGARYDLGKLGVKPDVNTYTFALSVRDEQGNPVFDDAFYLGFGATYALVDMNDVDPAYNKTYHRGGLLFEVGKNRMITTRLSLSFNARLNVTFARFWESFYGGNTSDDKFTRLANGQLQLHNFLTYSLTLGWKP